MEEFVVSPPAGVLYIAGALLLIGVVSLLFNRGDMRKRIIGLIVVAVVAVGLVVFLYRPITITVDEEGIYAEGRASFSFEWSEVESALYERDLPNSEYRPTVRRLGVAMGDYRTGTFLLSNGDPATVYTDRSDAAVIIRTDETTYLLAPDRVDKLAQAINENRVIE